MKKLKVVLVALSLILMAASCDDDYPEVEDGIYAEINTTKGTMFAKLYHDATPATVANFVALAEGDHPAVIDSLKGKPFYNGLIFHRVIENFMIQGGDPTGTGSGSVGYKFDQEIVDTLKHDAKGIMSMANSGPNTNGSKFFIMHKPTPSLDGNYNVFGKVIKGLEVVDSIATTPTGFRDKPNTDMVINSVKIIRKGKEAKKFDASKIIADYIQTSKDKEQERMEEARKEQERIAELAKNAPKLIEEKEKEFTALKKKAKKLPNSDVKVYVVKEGNGTKPEVGTPVLIPYSGFLTNGRMFDSSDKEYALKFNAYNLGKDRGGFYKPIQMAFDPQKMQLVSGFRNAIASMSYGEKIVAFIPSELAYGDQARGPIPANSDLIFELELLPVE